MSSCTSSPYQSDDDNQVDFLLNLNAGSDPFMNCMYHGVEEAGVRCLPCRRRLSARSWSPIFSCLLLRLFLVYAAALAGVAWRDYQTFPASCSEL
jgi:hypothetical protein